MVSPVYVMMLSVQAVRGLPRLRATGIVPYNYGIGIIRKKQEQVGLLSGGL